MRTYNHLYENEKKFREFVEDISFLVSDEILVRIHSAVYTKEEMGVFLGKVADLIPDAHIIGCSAMQVIYEGKLIPNACLISITVFENARIITGMIPCMGENGEWISGDVLAEDVLSRLRADNGGLMLAFFPRAYCKIEHFVDTINTSGKDIRMLGGASYREDENGVASEELSYMISGSRVSSSNMVFAYITSPEIYIYVDYVCGVESIGKKSEIVTDGLYINEVDGMDAAEWYSNMFGVQELEKHPEIAYTFPAVKRDMGSVACYIEYFCENGKNRIKSIEELKNGSSISLGYFNPQKIFNMVKKVMQNISQTPAESVFAYDCFARVSMLHDCASWEIGNFATTDISGALLGGEISSKDDRNLYANYTFVMAVLSEYKDSRFVLSELDPRMVRQLQEDNVQMLNYLLMNANSNMSYEYKEQHSKMQDAMFYNAALGVENQLKYLYDKERKGLNKTAIFSLDNEKMLRLFLGITETYAFLNDCYAKTQNRFREDGIYMYCYNDTSFFIAADDKVDGDRFTKIVDGIHTFLNSFIHGDIRLSYTTVVLFGEEDTIHRLETALNYARGHKLDKIRFDEIGDDLRSEQEDIHVLWVIREALVHKRVVPFFQEIHNNRGEEKKMFESLMRIMDADGNIYYPDRFLSVAKEYNLYESLSELMVKQVIEMFRHKDIRVTINLNVQDIYNRNMIRMIFNNMKLVDHPENFVFEIVESEEITDYEYIKGFADRIHEYGGKIAIDDFGSGFSNILHVLKLGADYIKVDGNIIRTITKDAHVRDFIEFMNGWCKKIGQELICEYIENEEIQAIMESIGVPHSQGYLFSKPHSWEE